MLKNSKFHNYVFLYVNVKSFDMLVTSMQLKGRNTFKKKYLKQQGHI